MATRTISTRITLDGEQEFKKQMSSVNSELRNLKSEMGLVEAEFKGQANSVEALTEKDNILRREIEQQKEKVRALEQALEDASEAYGNTDKRTDSYRQSLNKAKTELIKMNQELEDTDKYLKEAENAADGCATSIDEFGKSTEKSGGLLSEYGDKLKLLGAAGVAGVAVKGIKEIAGAVLELEESTREYRQIMGTLEVSSQSAGYTAEETAQVYERLYGVLGDTQTAATTVANLQAIGLEQEALMAVTDAAIGAWAKYGDSIPIDGLAEAINETVQAGKVTGVFADVLNWAGLSEDDFNERLATMSTEADRAGLIMRTLGKEDLANLGRAWMDVNDDIVAANESQMRMDEAMGRLGESLAPAANAIRNFGADAVLWLADTIEEAIEGLNEFWDAITKFDLENNERQRRMAANRGANVSSYTEPAMDPTQKVYSQMTNDNSAWASVNRSSQTGGSTSVPQNINLSVNLDGQQLARLQYNQNKAETARHGTNYVNK